MPGDVDTPAVHNMPTSLSSRTNLHKKEIQLVKISRSFWPIHRHSGRSAVGNDYSHPEMTESSSPNINNNTTTGPLCTGEFFISSVYQIKQNQFERAYKLQKIYGNTSSIYFAGELNPTAQKLPYSSKGSRDTDLLGERSRRFTLGSVIRPSRR